MEYGLIGADDHAALERAIANNDIARFADIAVPVCENSILLYGNLFLGQDIPPFLAEKWPEIERHRMRLIRIFRQAGKALALDTPIPTANGWKTMGTIGVGDRVFDENGAPCTVTFATDVQYGRECFRVTFNDGSSIVADAEHLWATQTKAEWHYKRMVNGVWSRSPLPPVPRTTREIAHSLLCKPTGKKYPEYNHRIPVARPFVLEEADCPIHPYALGVWLGDGTSSGASIATADDEIADGLKALGLPMRKLKARYMWSISDGIKTGRRGKRGCFLEKLRLLGLLKNKHIPEGYLMASYDQRLALLQGLMDTDGTCSKVGKISFTTTLPGLANSVYRLVASLGIVPNMTVRQPSIPGRPQAKCELAYHIAFSTSTPVFRLRRKLERQVNGRQKARKNRVRTVAAVESVESVPVRCIQVDSPSCLYLAGNSCVPTHNTTVFTNALMAHRVSYSTVRGSRYEDARVLAAFETQQRAVQRLGKIQQLFEMGGPGGLIAAVFRGPEGTPQAGMSIPEMAKAFGAWDAHSIDVPHPRGRFKPDPTIVALAPGMATVGYGPSDIVMDDLVGTKTANSPKKTENLRKWVMQDIMPMAAKGTVNVWVPHTVFQRDDLNRQLESSKMFYLLEVAALQRMPTKLDFRPIYDKGSDTIVDVELTESGRALRSAWPCPLGDEVACEPFGRAGEKHKAEVGYHRPVKELLGWYQSEPLAFYLQGMHKIVGSDLNTVKPWMLRFYTMDPDSHHIGKPAPWHREWDEWSKDKPDVRLDSGAPPVVLLTQRGEVIERRNGEPVGKIDACVQAWDLAVGKTTRNDRSVCCTMYRSLDKRYFARFKADRWRHDVVWRMIASLAATNPIMRPREVGVEVNGFSEVYKDEGAKAMKALNLHDSIRITEVRRTRDKDKTFAESGLPVAMQNGLFYVDVDDNDSIEELLSVMPDQSGGHDDIFDSAVNAYPLIRHAKKLMPGFLGGNGDGE